MVIGSVAPAVAGSRFYLTIEKSFATSQKPSVRIDFVDEGELIELRVLKPKDLNTFIEKQLNVSRSYEEPLSSVNPGHYLAKGINQVPSPLKLFRSAINPSFRKNFGGNEFNDPYFDGAQKLLSTPREIKVREPKGFEVIRTTIVNVQKDAAAQSGLYDFAWWDNYKYKIKEVELEPLPAGIYLVQAIQKDQEAQALLQVSSFAVQVKQSSHQLLLRAVSRDLKPLSNATVTVRDSRGMWQNFSRSTDENGELLFEDTQDSLDGKLVVKVTAPDGTPALADTDFLPSVSSENSSFIATDRPIFKPGDEFSYKGIVRVNNRGALTLPKIQDKEAVVALYEADGTDTGLQQKVPVSSFGSYSGTFTVPESQKPGLYRVISMIDGKPYSGELRIKDYVKPTFYLETSHYDPVLTPGEKFSMKVKAKRYAGGTPKGVRYEVYVYRKKFSSPVWLEEAGGGLSTDHDYTGATRSAASLAQPQRLYSSVEERQSKDGFNADTWSTAPLLNEDGTADITITLPKVAQKDLEEDWIYTVTVRAMDTVGAQAILNEDIYMTRSDAVAATKFEKNVYDQSEEKIILQINSLSPQGDSAKNAFGVVKLSFQSGSGTVSQLPEVEYRTDAFGSARVSMESPKERGVLTAQTTVDGVNEKKSDRPSVSLPVTAYIGGKDGEEIIKTKDLSLVTQSTILAPGQQEKILAILPSDWGRNMEGNREGTIWQSLAADKIHTSTSQYVKGRSVWLSVEAKPEYGTGFFQTVTVPLEGGVFTEQTIGFRILPKDKILSIQVTPSSEIAVPNTPFKIDLQVKDSDGKAAGNTELSVSVVDKAVYAVQPEFRAAILDFFYPLPRLNVGTFYSDELQGYGYSDAIKKPNFLLSALKSSIKPQNKSMRDTAGWFPHVITDANGKASVTVAMPSNITEWIVTAIAADKNGRVGETTGNFRSLVDVAVEPLLPPYLRDGDAVKGFVRFDNSSPVTQAQVRFEAKGSQNLSVMTAINPIQPIVVNQKSSETIPLEVKSTAGSNTKAEITLLADAPGLKVAGPQQFEVNAYPAVQQTNVPMQPGFEPGTLKLSAANNMTINKISLSAISGFAGAALLAADKLVTYPYGCTEQLAHSTFPNLALLSLVKSTNLDEQALKEIKLDRTFGKAKENAETGIRKIRANQNPDGGFSLWSVDRSSSLHVTLIAVRALKAALDSGIESARKPFEDGVGWLNGNLGKTEGAPDGREYMELLRMLSQVDEFEYAQRHKFLSFIESTLTAQHPSRIRLLTALEILSAAQKTYWFRGQFKKSAEETKKELIMKLRQILSDSEQTGQLAAEPSMIYDESGFYRGQASETARIVAALTAAADITEEEKNKFLQVITNRFEDNWWGSTYETGETIFNLMPVIQQEVAAKRILNSNGKNMPQVSVNGKTVGTLSMFFGGMRGEFVIPAINDTDLNVSVTNLDNKVYGLSGTAAVQIPFESLTAMQQGISVQRELLKITADGVAPLHTSNALNKGDTVVSKVTVKRDGRTNQWGAPSILVVLEDGIPSIGEGIEEDKTYLADAKIQKNEDSYWTKIKETLRYPDRVTRIVEMKPGTERVFYQVWRVRFDGDAALPPATAVDMYNDNIHGNSSAGRIHARS